MIKNLKKTNKKSKIIRCGNFFLETNTFIETLPNGIEYITTYKKKELYKILKNMKFQKIIIFY